jgi:hypothetical protein
MTERGKLTGRPRLTQGDEASTRTIDEGPNLLSAPSASQRVSKVAGLLMSDLGRGRESGRTMRVGYSRAVTESVDVFHADAGETIDTTPPAHSIEPSTPHTPRHRT